MRSIVVSLFCSLIIASCGSIKSTLKNVDPKAKMPKLDGESFILTEKANDGLFAYDPDYPVNLEFSGSENNNMRNITRFFNGISLNGKPVKYAKIDECCPYPTKNNKIGAGTLYIYEVKSEDESIVKKIYINIFERGKVLIPQGFDAKQ